MNGQFDEELVSACHDGELSESERQSVADRIADDGALREVLDEFAELSSALKSLPRSPAPEELHQTVMRQVRDTPAARPKVEASRPSRLKVWLWTAGTAASLLLAVGVIWIASGRNGDSGLSVAESGAEFQSDAAPEAAMTMAAAESTDEIGFQGAPPSRSAPFAEPPADASLPQMDSLDNDAQLRQLLRSLSGELEEGQVLQVLTEVDDELLLTEFMVVDIDETLGDVDVLLNRRASQALNEPGRSQSPDASAGAAVRPQSRLCGIYLEATPDDLRIALRENNLEEHVVLVDAAEPESPAVADAQAEADNGFQADLSRYQRVVVDLQERERDVPDDELLRDSDGTHTRSRILIVILEPENSGGN